MSDHKRIERIKEMEEVLNQMTMLQEQLSAIINQWEERLPDYQRLVEYYTSPEWHDDREASDCHELPEDMPHGVLSEDAVFDLMTTQRELALRTARTALTAIEQA